MSCVDPFLGFTICKKRVASANTNGWEDDNLSSSIVCTLLDDCSNPPGRYSKLIVMSAKRSVWGEYAMMSMTTRRVFWSIHPDSIMSRTCNNRV